jgi:hypothetical protein
MKKIPTINIKIGDKLMEFIPADSLSSQKVWKTGNASIDHILNGEVFKPLINSPEVSSIRDMRTGMSAIISCASLWLTTI